MDQAILHECLMEAFAGRRTFPETVEKMLATGVERYDVDLTRLEKRHFGLDGSTHLEAIPLADAPAVPLEFTTRTVQEAIRASQQGNIGYPEFLQRVMAAGTASYSVYLNGRKAIYFGRNGNFHVELFPS
ncbi:DUF1398 domain-containing protein [Singulisphaera sp. Ch08]|uniref:DUF1398 domain-containing protein n=1 Tax=Singulisphaera sp. Ch08 TaxID=3120278 RepID=A0AAU7CKJ2_9BACT